MNLKTKKTNSLCSGLVISEELSNLLENTPILSEDDIKELGDATKEFCESCAKNKKDKLVVYNKRLM